MLLQYGWGKFGDLTFAEEPKGMGLKENGALLQTKAKVVQVTKISDRQIGNPRNSGSTVDPAGTMM